MNTNMYKLSVKQWNPFVGCHHDCIYCKPSFQAQLKRWAKKNCQDCYEFKPHAHPERLTDKMPRTGFMQFIFTCSNGDVAFCPTEYLERILEVIAKWKDRMFLIQSKDPSTFKRVEGKLPKNLIIGTTIETNYVLHWWNLDNQQISKAPIPMKRFQDFLSVKHPLKMWTMEPVLNFDPEVIVRWAEELKPCMIWIGYDTKGCRLPEPSLERVKALHFELAKRGFIVVLKHIRKAWWET